MTSQDRDPVPADRQEGSRSSSSDGAAEDADDTRDDKAEKHGKLPVWQETLLLLVLALGLAILIKTFLIQAFYIPSPSMEPGFVRNDRILVQKVSYWGDGTPERGDIVVFKDPGGWLDPADSEPANTFTSVLTRIGLYPAGGHLVKRVIGVAGDRIECCDEQGRILVNGEPLEEDAYLAQDDSAQCNGPMIGCEWKTGPVPEGHIFVMGDNRNHSADSTVHICRETVNNCTPGDEFVPADLVVGKVFVLLWPTDHFRFIDRPDSFADVPAPKKRAG